MNRFLLFIVLLTTFLVTACYTGARFGFFALPTFLWLIECCLAALITAVYYFLNKRPAGIGFTQIYLFSIVTKICLFVTLMTFVILLDKANAGENVVLSIVSYVLFTTLEVAVLFRKFNGRRPFKK